MPPAWDAACREIEDVAILALNASVAATLAHPVSDAQRPVVAAPTRDVIVVTAHGAR
ncbi:MAG: hypothetical protein K0S40_3508 [Actinomycetospora sp.]|nr:hypothetical protein [Actinomycetospora sp.]